MIGVCADTLRKRVARIPVRREGGAAVEDQLRAVGRGGVFGEAGIDVGADRVAFLAVGLLLGEVLGVSGAEDVYIGLLKFLRSKTWVDVIPKP